MNLRKTFFVAAMTASVATAVAGMGMMAVFGPVEPKKPDASLQNAEKAKWGNGLYLAGLAAAMGVALVGVNKSKNGSKEGQNMSPLGPVPEIEPQTIAPPQAWVPAAPEISKEMREQIAKLKGRKPPSGP